MLAQRLRPFGWEESGASVAGLTLDQFRFTLSMFASILFCYGFRHLKGSLARHLYSVVTGFALLAYPFGAECLQLLVPSIVTYLAMMFSPKHCAKIAWVFNFSVLIYMHVAQASGLSWNEGKMDVTGGLMILVLKLNALATARQDSTRKVEHLNPYQQSHVVRNQPNLLEFLSYTVSMGSLLSGPFFEFSEFQQFINEQGIWSPKAALGLPSFFRSMTRAFLLFLESVVYFAVFVRWGHWNGTVMLTPWYHGLPLLRKYGVMFFTGAMFQFKYYAAWKLAEAGYVLAGFDFLGWEGKEETKQEEKKGRKPATALWGRCKNASFFGVWTADSARSVPQNWNICTGKWLRRYVYERITPRQRKPGFQHLLCTQFVCALWHGLFPGYQLFFFGTVIWIYMSQVLFRAETHVDPKWIRFLPYRVLKIVWTNVVLNYLASSFQLLLWKESIESYLEVYMIPHVILVGFCLCGTFVKPKRLTAAGKVGAGERGEGERVAGETQKKDL